MERLNQINDIDIAKHFKLSEFACPCCKRVMLHPMLLNKLVEFRAIIQKPLYITSGYRCTEYNQKVGGIKSSYHLLGLAADIKIEGVSALDLLEIAEMIDFSGIGLYEKKNFLHLDVRPTKLARWRG
jgi:uncharacterized protein YcbK (DUF882 family)